MDLWTAHSKDEVLSRIIEYCKRNNCSAGEVLMQDNDCLIEAPDLLADIIDDVLEFEIKR